MGDGCQTCANHTENHADECFVGVYAAYNTTGFTSCTNATTVGTAKAAITQLVNCVPTCWWGNKTEVIGWVPESEHKPDGVLGDFYRVNETIKFCENFNASCHEDLGLNCTTYVTGVFQEVIDAFNAAAPTGSGVHQVAATGALASGIALAASVFLA